MKKNQYFECYYDSEGNLRIKKGISKKEFEKAKPLTFMANFDKWRFGYGSVA